MMCIILHGHVPMSMHVRFEVLHTAFSACASFVTLLICSMEVFFTLRNPVARCGTRGSSMCHQKPEPGWSGSQIRLLEPDSSVWLLEPGSNSHPEQFVLHQPHIKACAAAKQWPLLFFATATTCPYMWGRTP